MFGKGITYAGRSDVSEAVAGLYRLQLCAVLNTRIAATKPRYRSSGSNKPRASH